jgi:predicted phosphodiesterase
MTDYLPRSVEHGRSSDSPHQIRRVLGKAGLLAAGSIIAAAPYSAMQSLTQSEVRDDVATVPSTLSFSPNHSSVSTGLIAGTIYDDGSFTKYGIGVSVDLDQPPTGLQSLDSVTISTVAQPFIDFYRDPTVAFEGNRSALFEETKDNARKTELLLGGALFVSGAGILYLARELPSKRRKQLASALFGTAFTASSLLSFSLYESWQDENALPEQTFAINGLQDTVLEGSTADTSFTAKAIAGIVPFYKVQAQRETDRRNDFIDTAKQTIDEQLEIGSFIPPKNGETLVMLVSDMHSNGAMIDIYDYMVKQINELYGDGTAEIVLSAGDNTYGSASEKGAIDQMANIAADVSTLNGNHDGEITNSNEEAAGMTVLNGETIQTSNPSVTVLGNNDPSLTKPNGLIGFAGDVSRKTGKAISFAERLALEEELGDNLLDEAEKTNPTFLLSHEAYSLDDVFDLDVTNKANVQNWFKEDSTVDDFPTELVAFGHWHPYRSKIRIVEGDNHNKAVVELGSAGGASGSNSLTDISTPFTAPAQPASVVFATVSENGTIKQLQEQTTDRQGNVIFHTPVIVNKS